MKKHQRLRSARAVPRRGFLAGGFALVAGGAGMWLLRHLAKTPARVFLPAGTLPIRPPGALADDGDFQSACVHCGLCGSVCDTGAIRFFGLDDDEHGAVTPYLDVRRRSCSLCMKCNHVCPSGALRKIEMNKESIIDLARMGVAEVDPELCISYLGRACGYCHDACPLPGHAIKLAPPATPVVITDGCVGCGRCVEQCPATPTAIAVVRRMT
jgi:MauM/NapG family ferredoxin protein